MQKLKLNFHAVKEGRMSGSYFISIGMQQQHLERCEIEKGRKFNRIRMRHVGKHPHSNSSKFKLQLCERMRREKIDIN